MSVTVILGRSGSGKSRYLTEYIKALIKDPFAKIIVIVPGSLTFETERSIISNCDVSGILGLQVFSIQRLAYAILEDTHEFITNATKAMVCKKALLSLNEPFCGASSLPDFSSCLAALISRLKSYNQTPSSLRKTKTTDSLLAKKLSDTADVFEQYLELCGDKNDSDDMYALAASKAHTADFLKDSHIVIDGMDSYSPAVMLMITQIIKQSQDTVASFRHHGEGSDIALFAPEFDDMQRFITAAKATGKDVSELKLDDGNTRYSCKELAHLEKNLYKYPYETFDDVSPNLRLFEADSIETEINIISSLILKEVSSGKSFSDIAVVAGNLANYVPTIKMKLNECQIPYFIDERRSLSDNTFFDFIYSSLCAAAGDALFITRYIYSRYSPIDETSRYTLKKYAQSYSYKGWHYGTEFWRGENTQQAEEIRKSVMMPLFALGDGINSHSAKKQIHSIIDFMTKCEVQQKISDFCESLDEFEMADQREYYEQIFSKMTDVMMGISNVFQDKPLPAKELIELIKTGCEATKIAVIPPCVNEVGFFDISLARLKNINVLFAIGVQDGVWPAKNDEPGIMSAKERESLFDLGLDIGVSDFGAEKLKVYTALIKPKDKLFISYNTQSAPSVLTDRIKRIFPHLKTEKSVPVLSLKGSESAVLGQISCALDGGDVSESLIETCAKYLAQQNWRQKATKVLTRTNEAHGIDKKTAIKLYGGIKCSATRIESYYKCPFAHFIERGIKAKPDREYVGNSLDTGTFLHLALDLFAQGLLDDKQDIKQTSFDEVTTRIISSAKSAAELHENAKLLKDDRFTLLYPLLVQDLINTAKRIKTHFDGTEAKIFSSEQIFSDYTIETKFGSVTVSGKIDRIDTSGDYFRVVDYKSSRKSFSLSQFASGTALQLPIYIEATRRFLSKNANNLLPAGGYYMQVGEAYKESDKDLSHSRRLLGISLNDAEVLQGFSTQHENGAFTSIDQSVTSKGMLNGISKDRFFTHSELNRLLELTDVLIHDAAVGMYSGGAGITPVKGSSSIKVCEYCEYKSVCMLDIDFAGNEYREIEPFDKTCLGASDEY